MRTATALIGIFALAALQHAGAAGEERAIPGNCPVTRATPETRFTPPAPSRPSKPGDAMFWYGDDPLYTHLYSDGRWRGITSETGTRNKSFWYRKDAEWLEEFPYQLVVTAKQLDAEGPLVTFPRVTNAIMGKEVAMLLMLELPRRGCWQVTANYKSDYLSFITWVD